MNWSAPLIVAFQGVISESHCCSNGLKEKRELAQKRTCTSVCVCFCAAPQPDALGGACGADLLSLLE